MRFLIAAALFACASAVPSGLLAPAPYHGLGYAHAPLAHAPLVHAPVAHLAPALPTISSGDIQAAAIDAHVDAADHTRAAYDAAREHHDQAAEYHGRAINAAEDHAWQSLDAVKTVEAKLDGAAAAAAPVLAKSLVGHAAPLGYAASYAAPLSYAHGPVSYASAAPLSYASSPLSYAHAPALSYAHGYAPASKTVVKQSLTQSHPAPLYQSYAHGPVSYAAHTPVSYAAHVPVAYGAAPYTYAGHGW